MRGGGLSRTFGPTPFRWGLPIFRRGLLRRGLPAFRTGLRSLPIDIERIGAPPLAAAELAFRRRLPPRPSYASIDIVRITIGPRSLAAAELAFRTGLPALSIDIERIAAELTAEAAAGGTIPAAACWMYEDCRKLEGSWKPDGSKLDVSNELCEATLLEAGIKLERARAFEQRRSCSPRELRECSGCICKALAAALAAAVMLAALANIVPLELVPE